MKFLAFMMKHLPTPRVSASTPAIIAGILFFSLNFAAAAPGTGSVSVSTLASKDLESPMYDVEQGVVRQGVQHSAAGRYQEALDAFLQAVAVDPTNAFA